MTSGFGVACCSALSVLTMSIESLADEPLGEASSAIYAGTPARECEWPSVVAVGEYCSGTLVHPNLVVYAAHCGTAIEHVTFGETLTAPRRRIAVKQCERHPDFVQGGPADVAYCVLAESASDVSIIPLATGCEIAGLSQDLPVSFVGFGFDRDFGGLGTKRWGTGNVVEIAELIEIGSDTSNTCPGDSGGPVFASLNDLGFSGDESLRLVAVTSTGPDAYCQPNRGHYVRVDDFIPWLERASRLDLTPCFADDGSWAPGEACVDSIDARFTCSHESDPAYRYASSCGAPYAEGRPAAFEPSSPSAPEGEEGCSVSGRGVGHTPWPALLALAGLLGFRKIQALSRSRSST